jgi:transposase-like protein
MMNLQNLNIYFINKGDILHMETEKSTKIYKINCPNCDAEVFSFEIVGYYLNGRLKFSCPYCGNK